LYRQSGYGVFADRDFEVGEYIGPFLGDVKILEKSEDSEEESNKKRKKKSGQANAGKKKTKKEQYQSSYSLESPDGYIVDAKGSLWNHLYFGLHLVNDPRVDRKCNVKADEKLRFIALKKIKKGDELFFSYGRDFWKTMHGAL